MKGLRVDGLGNGLATDLLVALCDRAPDAVCVMERHNDDDYRFAYLNAAFERLYVCRRSATLGSDVRAFMRERSEPEDQERVAEGLARDEPFRVRRQLRRPDGTRVALEANFQPLPWTGGRRWLFTSREVTAEFRRHVRMTQLAAAVERGFDGVSISVREGDDWAFSYLNEAFTHMTGYTIEDLEGRHWSALIPDRLKLENLRAALLSGQQVRVEMELRKKDGTEATFEAAIQPLKGTGSDYESMVTVLRDVTEVRRREEQLSYEAQHDSLTGLLNRRAFERMVSVAIDMTRQGPVHALIFADLDGFKDVNDRFGHEAGDDVLKWAAAAFKHVLFDTDEVARWGGDEFAALLLHCSVENAVTSANSILESFLQAPQRRNTGMSLGVVAVLPGETPAQAIQRADAACYLAKAAGGGRVCAGVAEEA